MDLGPRKRWGQNFLINRGAREKIVSLLELQKGDHLWEIGPGLGAMTQMALLHPIQLTAFEIDPAYVNYLQKTMAAPNFKILSGDVLKTWKGESERQGPPQKVLGNLPYNAASAIVGSFIEEGVLPQLMVLTVQKEMGDRMRASPGTKDYSSFSILCQAAFQVEDGGILKPGSFYPSPRVSSRIIRLRPHGGYSKIKAPELFQRLIRDIFISRRKTIRNNLSAMAQQRFQAYGLKRLHEAFEAEGVQLSWRPERVQVDQFISIANRLQGQS